MLVPGLLAFFLLRLPQIVDQVVGVREGLRHAVVRNGDGRVAPLIGPLHDVLHLGNPVHVAHLGMAVQLHPLAQAVILAAVGEVADLFQTHQGADGQLPVKAVDHGHALELHEGAGLNPFAQLGHLIVFSRTS